MPFPFQAMGLGQFGRGGVPYGMPPKPEMPPWMTGQEVEPPGGYTDAWWNGLDPREQAWRESQAVRENWGNKGQPQGMPGGYGGAPMPPMGQQQMPWQQPAFNPTQQRHNAWVGQHGGLAPLSQYPQFGQGSGWGGFGGALGSAFGMRR